MTRSNCLAAAAAAAAAADARKKSNDLLPPAIKGLVLGFVGGLIAIAAFVILSPKVTQLDAAPGHASQTVPARIHGNVTATPVRLRR